MSNPVKRGKRLIPVLIDAYAKDEPNRIWAVQPKDESDISLGFNDITYHALANAINHATRWLKTACPTPEPFETIAYAGPKDIRYSVMAVAALKCHKKLLVCSLFARSAAQSHLLKLSKCTKYLHAASMKETVQAAVADTPEIEMVEVPELSEWLTDKPAEIIPYTKTWEEAENDPWLLFHTSGTTGMPKLLTFVVEHFHSQDAVDAMPDLRQGEFSYADLFQNRRYFIAIPNLHVVGMVASLQWTTFYGVELVLGPKTMMPNSAQIIQLLQLSLATGAVMPPSMIGDICREPGGLATLRNLWACWFCGAPISKKLAEPLMQHTKVLPLMGSTEGGVLWLGFNGKDDWEWYRVRSTNGADFVHRGQGLYELVIRNKPEIRQYQQYFKFFPEREEYATNDLWIPHPTRTDAWKFAGRGDDMVQFSHGEELFATGMEEIIQEHPKVRGALVGGDGKMKPFLLLDLFDRPAMSDEEKAKAIDDIWPFVDKANEKCLDFVKLTKELVLFTDEARPLPLTVKDTVRRRPALELYAEEIERLYAS